MTQAVETTQTRKTLSPKENPKGFGRAIFGLFVLVASVGYLVEAMSMPSGTLERPGPGMFPLWVGVAAVIISILVIIEAFLGKSESGSVDLPRGAHLKVSLVFIGTFLLYVLLLPVLGQYVTSSLYVIAFLRFGGNTSWLRSIVVGVAIGVGLSFAFTELLGITMPSGMLF